MGFPENCFVLVFGRNHDATATAIVFRFATCAAAGHDSRTIRGIGRPATDTTDVDAIHSDRFGHAPRGGAAAGGRRFFLNDFDQRIRRLPQLETGIRDQLIVFDLRALELLFALRIGIRLPQNGERDCQNKSYGQDDRQFGECLFWIHEFSPPLD
jgi:hypothetical protein